MIAGMAALMTLLPDAKSLSRTDKLRLIQLLAQDLADADGSPPLSTAPTAARPSHIPGPRLADPARAGDFVKHVREVAPDPAV